MGGCVRRRECVCRHVGAEAGERCHDSVRHSLEICGATLSLHFSHSHSLSFPPLSTHLLMLSAV